MADDVDMSGNEPCTPSSCSP